MQIKYTLGRGDYGVSVPEDVDEGDWKAGVRGEKLSGVDGASCSLQLLFLHPLVKHQESKWV